MNELYFGDCLDILKELQQKNSEPFIDLIYIDPPFNSKRNYNVLFESILTKDANAQKQAFADTWSNISYIDEKRELAVLDKNLYDFIQALDSIPSFGKSGVAYLTTMAIRVHYMHKLLKNTGSFYLHCDNTMSHYLKIICDIVFGYKNYRNEIIWKRTSAGKPIFRNLPRNADNIFWYSKSDNYMFNLVKDALTEVDMATFNLDDNDGRGPYNTQPIINPDDRPNLKYTYVDVNGKEWKSPTKGWRFNEDRMRDLERDGRLHFTKNSIREKYYLSERLVKGKQMSNIWTDIPIPSRSESLGYPTQKPEALLERIITASSNPGDLVADFFCGCGTTVSVAQKLDRKWLGVDISHLAIRLILKRIRDAHGETAYQKIRVFGFPKDIPSAKMLAEETQDGRYSFQEWAIEVLLGGVCNTKKSGDGGYDGYITFDMPEKKEFILIETKSGKVNINMTRAFVNTINSLSASMGFFVCFAENVTKGMELEFKQAGYFREDLFGARYPKVQLVTIEDLMHGIRPSYPESLRSTFKSAERKISTKEQKGLFDI